MARRKVILPNWSVSKEMAQNREGLETNFSGLTMGELVVNTTSGITSLATLDNADTPVIFESSEMIDKRLEGFLANANIIKEIRVNNSALAISSDKSVNIDLTYLENKIENIELKPGPQGERGPQGEKGADGTSVTIKGSKESEEELPKENNLSGDGYIINGRLFVWDGSSWNNVGEIKGPQGEVGPQGAQGAQGEVGPQGAQGAQGEKGALDKEQVELLTTELKQYTDNSISVLVGNDSGKTIRSIASEEIAAQLIGENPSESLDTLEEIAAWIQSHPEDAASMNAQIIALQKSAHTHDNKGILDGITAEKVAAWNAAEANAVLSAQTYADSLVENLKPYSGGTAVDVTDYTINVNVAKDSFLKVNESNELAVTGVTLDAAVTSKDIIIEGGAWESAVKEVFTGGTVPAGTTWESFLESMLCVEKFASPLTATPSFTVSCGNINPGISKTGTVEVGTEIVLNETNANATTASQSLTIKSFAGTDGKVYGYKLGEDGAHVNSSTYQETLTPILKTSNDALKITFSNFTDKVNDGAVIATMSGNTTLPSVTMYAMEGTNKVVVSQTGDTYTSSSAVTAGTIYIATNLKNYYKEDKKTPNTYVPTFAVSDKTASDSTEYTVTGAHYYYIGDVMDYSADYWDTDRSEMIRNLSTKGWANVSTITKAHTFGIGTKQQTVVVPSKYTNVSGKDVNNGDVQFNLVKTFDFTNGQGYISSYNVFVAPSTDGLGSDSKITITIK